MIEIIENLFGLILCSAQMARGLAFIRFNSMRS